MIFHKVFEAYEADTISTTNLTEKLALRPSGEDWLNCRQVIEHWDRTIRVVAEKDMSHDDFKQLQEAVLNTTVMDQQIMDVVRGYPKLFHLAMIPDLKAYYTQEVDEEKEKMQESNALSFPTCFFCNDAFKSSMQIKRAIRLSSESRWKSQRNMNPTCELQNKKSGPY